MTRLAPFALGALLLAAAPAAAQSCLESPLPPAGWLVSVGGRYAPEAKPDYDLDTERPAATSMEVAIARDLYGPAAAMVSASTSGYDVEVFVYDPDDGSYEPEMFEVGNTHIAARLALDLLGSVPACPFVEAGGFRATLDGGSEAGISGDFGGVYAGTGWTLHPHWLHDSGLETSVFFTARLIVIVASSLDREGSYERGQEVLPKLGFRIGGNAAWRVLFVGADAGVLFPAADPEFWMRHNSADEKAALSVGLRAGVRF